MEDAEKLTTLERRGRNYVGVCPICRKTQLCVSVIRQVTHCFGCGNGGILSGAAKEMMQAIFLDKNEDFYPRTIKIHIPVNTTGKNIAYRIRLAAGFQAKLPPNIAPFMEMAQLAELGQRDAYFVFPFYAAVAFKFCSSEKHIREIQETLSNVLSTSMTVHLSLEKPN